MSHAMYKIVVIVLMWGMFSELQDFPGKQESVWGSGCGTFDWVYVWSSYSSMLKTRDMETSALEHNRWLSAGFGQSPLSSILLT